MSQLEIRKYSEKDLPAILRLFELSFKRELPEAEFRWKYKRPGGAAGYVAVEDAEVIVFYGGLRLEFQDGQKKYTVYQLSDVMTHPAHRGKIRGRRPPVVRAGELLYRENPMDFAFGFPSERHARLQALMLGGEGYRFITRYDMPVKQEKTDQKGVMLFSDIRQMNKKYLEGFSKYPPRGLSIIKSPEYLRWRYMEHPGALYGGFVKKGFLRPRAASVYRVSGGVLNLLDFYYDETLGAEGFFACARKAALMAGAESISLWRHPKDPLSAELDRLGFARSDAVPIAYRIVDAACGMTAENFYGGYYYSMGDYDAS